MKLRNSRVITAAAIGSVLLLSLAACRGSDTGSEGGGGGEAAGDDTITIGVLATDTGNLAFGMDAAKEAINAVLKAEGDTIGGKKLEFVYEGTDGTSSSAQTKVKKLVENDGVDIVLGPVSGDEGETVTQYALTVPDVTFVNGSASPVSQTLEGATNFFRFHGDSAMWMGGVGDYAYNEKGYKKIYGVAEDYSFPYDNAGGFFSEFCAAGGDLTGFSWVPVGTTDYATIISQIPRDVDAVYVGLGGADAASFLSQAVTNGLTKPLVGGSIAVDPTALGGDANIRDAAIGTITGGPVPGSGYDTPEWNQFLTEIPTPNIFSLLYYNSFKSLYLGLKATDGELGDGQETLRDALKSLDWDSPTGNITLDKNNQGIVDNFITEVQANDDGTLGTVTISEDKGVKQGTTVYDRFESCPS
ncbi:ABC transporter substrate-binding protein [Naasia lichenicola]|uniref:ABC transporter substrate-binding protein n=1 Tax=Naasia lichenicola TaxID=2565933 RepID=A0A4S4FHC9_9MICO|nr:ABC transporter substrate-binding protein [Naasia lichenicola]THG29408.1 ABC transporter substrate-binding protein [Naasia lichenicola]